MTAPTPPVHGITNAGSGRIKAAVAWYLRRRYAILLTSLFATLVASPLTQAFYLPGDLIHVLVAVNLVAAVAGISERAAIRRPLLVASALVLALTFVPPSLLPAWAGEAGQVVWVLIAGLAAVAAVRFALRATAVDPEHIAAALSAYLLVGLVFAMLYVLLDRALPGSLVEAGTSGGDALTLDTAIYFSYVTLATLGYGDVVPKEGAARGLAIVEALGAQLYLTVTVARLVGLHAQGGRHRGDGGPQ